MFKKLLIYFLLLNFLNTVFFCNNDPEDYIVFKNQEEIQKEEINSIVEYVVEECLNIEDTTPEDEDDDWDDHFKTEKKNTCTAPTDILDYTTVIAYTDCVRYATFINSTFNNVFLEITSPPPRQA